MVMKRSWFTFSVLVLLLSVLTFLNSAGQPHKGPYGPVSQSYIIPETEGRIVFVAPDGRTENSGQDVDSPITLEKAVAEALSDDVIVLRGGLYRTGNLRFNQGITMQPYKDEKPVLKGTYVADQWETAGENLWVTSWPHLFPAKPEDWWRGERFLHICPLHRFNDDMVFIDGRFLQSAGSTEEVDTNTFYIDYENERVYIGMDPAERLVEITAFNVAVHRVYNDYKGVPNDGMGPKIKGIVFTQYADTAILIEGTYPEGPMDESMYGNDVVGTLLENCEISWCSRIGAYLMGDSLTIRNCNVSHTSTEGIYLVGASDALIEGTIIVQNNIEHLVGYFPAAVKIFNQSHRVTCRNNRVTDQPNSNGIWYDVGNKDGIFVNNWIENVGTAQKNKYNSFRYRSGFFFEISNGATVAGNLFLNCDNGSFVLNSSDVEIYQNTYVNSKVAFGRTSRSAANDHFGWHPATGPDVDERDGHVFMNNLVVQNDEVEDAMLEAWQAPELCDTLETPHFKYLDHNVYVNQIEDFSGPQFIYSAVQQDSCIFPLNSVEELNELQNEFSGNSILLKGDDTPVFLDAGNLDFRLQSEFPGLDAAGNLPERIRELLDNKEKSPYIGAYPLN